jgi:ribosomal protein S18 acetylase RimI-like enzyme
MLELLCDPPAPPPRSKSEGSFHQIIRLVDGPETIAQAHWQCGGDISEGVAQILELTVSPARRRQGHGRKVMDAITAQAKAYFQSRKVPLRRIWITLEQKRQVIARSFLMKFGFHHVGTVHEMLKDEDMLIYMRTFD